LIVPEGKKWFLIGGVLNRSVSATSEICLYDENGNIILVLMITGAAVGRIAFPSQSASISVLQASYPIPMLAGWYLRFDCDAAQTSAAYITYLVVETNE